MSCYRGFISFEEYCLYEEGKEGIKCDGCLKKVERCVLCGKHKEPGEIFKDGRCQKLCFDIKGIQTSHWYTCNYPRCNYCLIVDRAIEEFTKT